MLYAVASLATLCFMVFCVLSVITTPDAEVRNLPKVVWLILCLLFPLVGGIAWLVAGRPQTPARSLPYKGNTGVPAEYDRPGRATAASPDDDAAFLRQLRERAEAQRAAAAEQRRAELEAEERRRAQELEQRRRRGDEPAGA